MDDPTPPLGSQLTIHVQLDLLRFPNLTQTMEMDQLITEARDTTVVMRATIIITNFQLEHPQ